MYRPAVLTSLMLSISLMLPATYADEKMPEKIRSVEGITEYRLENGLKILLFPDVSRPTVTVSNTIFVGSRHEGYGEAGMAHLLEHMVFKGTPTHEDIGALLKERGARANGTTWFDRTNYYETMAASDDNLEFAIRLEADRMVNSLIRKEDLDSEMTVVRNEFESGENNHRRVLMQKMMGAAYEWHNYGKSTIGNRADIELVPVDNLREFYRRYYQPDNAMVVVAGKFDEDKALGLIQKYFGPIPRPERKLRNTYTEEPAQDGDRLVTLKRVGDVPLAGVAYHIPAGSHPDFAPIDILATLLSNEPSGRLYDGLVKKRRAASVMGMNFALHDPGICMFAAEAAPGVEASDLLQELAEIIETRTEEGFTQKEVERARQQLLKQWELSLTNTRDIAIELSDWAAMGDWRLFFLYRDRLEQVAAEDVQRVAKQYFISVNRTAGLFEPTEVPARAFIPKMPDLEEMIGDYKGREQIASGEAFDASPLAIERRITRGKLPGGIEVALLPRKTRGATVNLRLVLRYGNLKSLQKQGAASTMLPALMMRGTENLSRQEIRDKLDEYRARVGLSGSPGELRVTVQTLRGNLMPVLQVVGDVLRNPSFPEEELELIRQARVASVEQRLSDPTSLASNTAQKKISNYDKDDPRFIPSMTEEIEQIKAVTLEQVKAIYNDQVSAQAGELSIVGDFDPNEVMPAIAQLLSDWNSDVEHGRVPRVAVNNEKGSRDIINTPDKAQATYFAAYTLPFGNDHEDYPALVIGNFILGGGSISSRLGNRVRQEEGLSYTIASQYSASAVDDRGIFYIYAIMNPENLGKLETALKEEIQRLLKDGVTDKELKASKEGFLQQQELTRTQDASLATLMGAHLLADRTMNFTEEFEASLRDLTVEDVNSALRKHLKPERLYVVIAGDLQGDGDRGKPKEPQFQD